MILIIFPLIDQIKNRTTLKITVQLHRVQIETCSSWGVAMGWSLGAPRKQNSINFLIFFLFLNSKNYFLFQKMLKTTQKRNPNI